MEYPPPRLVGNEPEPDDDSKAGHDAGRRADRDADPDAEGLPPTIKLPDRLAFARDQHLARVASNGIGLVVLLLLWLVVPGRYPKLLLFLALLMGTLLLSNLLRWRIARQAADRGH
ncbi:MAG: hypothetical protein NTW19_03980 [Planctomycetota bacterium]|nr:hypothetical protein [Planctomycetota bacterium]